MSRLIVKNLPSNITENKLRELFSQKGEITDVQLKYTKDGKFRNFGFVGFKSEDQASEAKEYFHNSCISTSRIAVEPCVSLGDSSKPQAWSKYAADSSAYKKSHGKTKPEPTEAKTEAGAKLSKEERKKLKKQERDAKIREILSKHKDDPLFAEFMEVHASKLDKAIWSNDAVLDRNNSGKSEGESVADAPVEEEADSGFEKDEETSKEIKKQKKKEKKEKKEKLALQAISDLEYMKSLMKKKSKSTGDDADETEEVTGDQDEEEAEKEKTKKKKEPRNRLLFFVKLQGLAFTSKKKDVKEFFRPLVPFTIRIPRIRDKHVRGFCYVGFRSEEERKKAMFKSKSFMNGNRIFVNKFDSKHVVPGSEAQEEPVSNFRHKAQEDSLKNEETIAESGRIYVRNLPYVTTENELQELFEKFGPVTEANLPIDKITRQSKGFGHITFMMPEHAVKAYTELDGSVFCGRMLHLLPGKTREELNPDEEGLTFKQKKERQQKQQAGSAHNWNSLFLGANAVADVVASTYNTTKEKLLEGNAKTSAAVRLALGETQLVASTKKFLEDNGVSLDVFNQVVKKRSKTVILVKNMPAESTREELEKLFSPFGIIARLVMPPHGITALIEFVEPSEARQAFSKLAYTKFKYLPLYLEWAPDNIFNKPAKQEQLIKNTKKEDGYQDKKNKKSEGNRAEELEEAQEEVVEERQEVKVEEEDDVAVPEADTVLFVKGLHFDTREGSLQSHFESCGRVYSATVALKKDPHNPGQKLSMGYGFVQYYSKYATEKALKDLQFKSLDGRQLEIKRSERTGGQETKTAKQESVARKQTGTKILVRNVPFQANQREIQEVFGTFGEIKSLRMPKKMVPGENRHRGFCFVEYYNKSDAKSAFEALCQSTHLYGRRLALEWAMGDDETETVEALRKRTADTFNQAKPGGKKSRKAVMDLEGMEEDEEE